MTGTAGAIYGITGKEGRGAVVAGILYLILAFSGGCFIPLESLPNSVRAIAPFSLFYWGTTGYRMLMESGAGLSAIIPNVCILAGIGIPLMVLGSVLLGRRIQQGGAA
jgi:ABC-type multidrug transport system permease subunit